MLDDLDSNAEDLGTRATTFPKSKNYISQSPLQPRMATWLNLGQWNESGRDACNFSISFLKKAGCPLLHLFPSPTVRSGENWNSQPPWSQRWSHVWNMAGLAVGIPGWHCWTQLLTHHGLPVTSELLCKKEHFYLPTSLVFFLQCLSLYPSTGLYPSSTRKYAGKTWRIMN